MRGAVRNKERWKGCRAPTQDPSTNAHLRVERDTWQQRAHVASGASSQPDSNNTQTKNHVGRGWGYFNGAMGAVRLPKILVLTIDGLLSAQSKRKDALRAEKRSKQS